MYKIEVYKNNKKLQTKYYNTKKTFDKWWKERHSMAQRFKRTIKSFKYDGTDWKILTESNNE